MVNWTPEKTTAMSSSHWHRIHWVLGMYHILVEQHVSACSYTYAKRHTLYHGVSFGEILFCVICIQGHTDQLFPQINYVGNGG